MRQTKAVHKCLPQHNSAFMLSLKAFVRSKHVIYNKLSHDNRRSVNVFGFDNPQTSYMICTCRREHSIAFNNEANTYSLLVDVLTYHLNVLFGKEKNARNPLKCEIPLRYMIRFATHNK